MPGLMHYQVFGLTVRSELALPELFASTSNVESDVTIRVGHVAPPPEPTPGLHLQDGGLLLVVPDVGLYRIAGGTEIIVEPAAGAPERNVRLYLLGSAFGALLHQRGLLPLHANAIDVGGAAVAFMGPSGEGKSTIAAWFHDLGYRVIADDVCVVRLRADGRADALPGLARLRLWQDVLEASGRDSADYERSYAADETWNKFDVPIAHATAENREVELGVIYVLSHGDEFAIRRLHGVEAAEAVFANTYRGSYIPAARGEQRHWLSTIRLVQGTPVYLLTRPLRLERISGDCRRVLDHVRAHALAPPKKMVQS